MEIYKRERLYSLAIVILNYNGIQWFEQFLGNIIKYSPKASLYVIDNASTDNSVEYLQKYHPEVKIIHNDRNYGYAGGYNKGLEFVKEDVYCLLNSDVEVTENWIEPVMDLLESDKEIAAVQPKILDFNNKDKFEFAGAGGGFIDNLGYPFCRGRVFFDLEKDQGQYDDIQEIFWATGACFFIKREDFWEQKGFDAVFFAHMEEIDLCWRLKNTGKKIGYCGKTKVYHAGGGTLSANNPKKTYLNFRNNLLMLVKNLPANKVFRIILLRMILDGFAGLKYLYSDGWQFFYAVIKAHISFYSLLPQYIRKRKPGITSYYKNKYIVFQYFLKKRQKFKDLH